MGLPQAMIRVEHNHHLVQQEMETETEAEVEAEAEVPIC